TSSTVPNRDGDICESFQSLRGLIDAETLANLTLAHYQCDAKFRKAVCYYNTSRFNVVIEQLQNSEAYQELLNTLIDEGVNIDDIGKIADIFSCLALSLNTTSTQKCDCKTVRKHTFLEDVLAALPKQSVHDFTSRARERSTNFGLFTETLLSPQFQSSLRSRLSQRDVLRALHVLRRNGWDLPQLLRGASTVLSW
ncbi:hypothetical protein KR222_009010, partial [Zaprionus bogoriensis]